jgi:hypothetical protein
VATSFDKNDKSSRRAVADDIRKRQARKEKRQTLSIVGVAVLVALIIVAAAAYKPVTDWWDLRQFRGKDLAAIGEPATVCGKEITKSAEGSGQHVQEGTPINYADAPPAFGQHYYNPDPMSRKLYAADDRPALGTLVHNEEHGYTILWFDQTVADDPTQMGELRGIADKLQGTGNNRLKFKAVPWLSTDEMGKKLPEGQHVALTHWSAGKNEGGDGKQKGVWQYCSAVSGEALKDFMLKYPYLDSPEPDAP